MATTKEADLITAVLIYAIRCLGEADQSALRAMGFGPREIDALQRLNIADLCRVEAICAHCLRVDLNREVFWHMVEHIGQLRASEELQQTLIKADAPQAMMQALFGLGAKEYTRRRRLMTLEPAVGRKLGREWRAVGRYVPLECDYHAQCHQGRCSCAAGT